MGYGDFMTVVLSKKMSSTETSTDRTLSTQVVKLRAARQINHMVVDGEWVYRIQFLVDGVMQGRDFSSDEYIMSIKKED